jgi:hypothetical protein
MTNMPIISNPEVQREGDESALADAFPAACLRPDLHAKIDNGRTSAASSAIGRSARRLKQ